MSFTKPSFLLALAAAAGIAQVSAHGIVQGIVADDIWYSGYQPSFQYQNPPPSVAGWSIPKDQDLGFVNDTASPDIVCHVDATPGSAYVTVAAGDTVELQWTVWPESHHGPVIDYLASCDGDCTTVDKTKLLFSKIDQGGLINGAPAPGTWASDTLIANNNSWTVTIPSEIAPGKYVLRHEIIALHSAFNLDGFQAYPQCINLEITGSGTDTLSTGTVAQDFYQDTDPGLYLNIYYPVLTNYTIPGPALIADAVSASQSSVSASATATVTATPTSGASTHTNLPISAKITGPYMNATTTSTTTTTTTTTTTIPGAEPSTHAAAVSTTSSDSWAEPATTSSSAVAETSSEPWNSTDGADDTSPTSSTASTPATSGISFTSTFTGRIGKPTKFTCYIDED